MTSRSADPSTSFVEGSEPRFYVGALSLFYVSTVVMLAIWAMLPSVALGWNPVVITSGSMQPTIRAGDIVVASAPEPGLGKGTVVVFEDPARGGLVTHRIWSARTNGEYITKGDANQQPDSTPLTDSDIRGIGRLLVPLIGLPGLWARTNPGLFAAWALLTAAAFSGSRWALYRKYDPWSGAESPYAGRHRSPKVYVGRHLRPPRYRLAGPAIKVTSLLLLMMFTASYASSRAAWAADTGNSLNSFASAAYGPLTTVDVGIGTTASSSSIKIGEDVTFFISLTNYGTEETSGTVTSSVLADPFTVIVPDGETVVVQVVWGALLTGINDFLFTVTADSDEVLTNNIANVQVEVLP